jgi:glycosyltransferase involved in cell wall biosynthesis
MTVRPRVHQVLATLGYGDAIGHEVLGVQRVLRSAGYESEIFVETADRRLEDCTIDYREMVGAIAPEDVLVHHFSIGSRASRTAYALPGRMALVYHNITPPHYFVGVHRDLVKQCFRGRRELTAYVDRSDLALGDSEYNRQELEALGFPRTGVLPVVPDFSHLVGPPSQLLASDFDDEWTNVLFVGRVIPNKKFETIIRAFHVYRTRHNPRARLLLVGSYSGFERYLSMLQELIATLGTPDVHFLGHVSNEELTALYDVADLFLCASAHEGFCVPIIEAFYKGVPALAYASTAVPATMDGGGVLYDTTDPGEIARLMEAVLDDPAIAEGILRSQDAALARLQARDFAGTLLRFVDEVIAGPPRPAPAVAWDFWAQFEQFERFEELRQFRPALFQALPAPGIRDQGSGRGEHPSAGTTPNRDPRSLIPDSGIRDPGSGDGERQSAGTTPNPDPRSLIPGPATPAPKSDR